jgi:adenine-specific DNA-methyltransferase
MKRHSLRSTGERRKKPGVKKTVKIQALRHNESSRKNIPTVELEAFAPEVLKEPVPISYERSSAELYPRNPDADPQLVWRGKDMDDGRGDLVVPSLPIYVHEHITPQQIIDSVVADSQGRDLQPELFDRDFNGLGSEHKLDFYVHDRHWSNRIVLGDCLSVMTSLAEKEGLKGQVQTIYVDPPYGVEFSSNWQVATNNVKVKDGQESSITTEPEQIKAFRDTWKLGVHSYLSYLRDRLTVARELLTDTGSIFVQIGDKNAHLVRAVMDEVFGVGNWCNQIAYTTTSGLGSALIPSRVSYLLWYAKNKKQVKFKQLYGGKSREDGTADTYSWLMFPDGSHRGMKATEKRGEVSLPEDARIYKPDNITSQGNPIIEFTYAGKKVAAPYKPSRLGLERLAIAGRIHVARDSFQYVRFLDDFEAIPLGNMWTDTQTGSFTEEKLYVVYTNTKVIERCILLTSDPGDLVLDPTCGSGTSAYCAEKWGRRWITIDTSRVALAITRQRLMTATFPYFILADSLDGRAKEQELSGQAITHDLPSPTKSLARGFVCKRVRHIKMSDITQNDEIVAGVSKPAIEESIRRHADFEYLVDEPLEAQGTIRVAGPFTVESLSPMAAGPVVKEGKSLGDDDRSGFVETVLDNMLTSGFQNRLKGGRTKFEQMERMPGEYINAIAVTNDKKRFAIAVGPKFGTIGLEFMRAAGREALNMALADALVVCGFSFDDSTNEKQLGKLLILKVWMDQDLQMDGVLKRSKSANLFVVYGEPDIELRRAGDKFVVELKGMDVYDPVKRDRRPAGPESIAAWFIDTDYNAESFIVRHVYFLGSGDAYKELKETLRTEVDEEAWKSLYRSVSRPFGKPESGRIAVKVITHYGDEAVVVRTI